MKDICIMKTEITEDDIQRECKHHWGPDIWTWAGGGYYVCTKCGKIEEFNVTRSTNLY